MTKALAPFLDDLPRAIKFKVAGQQADPKWKQTMLKKMVDLGDAPTEALRYQCRIATDARENLATVELTDGETLTLHRTVQPQFGKNSEGRAFLTATMMYSGDGQGYRFQWIGDAVPRKMQEVAVKHDGGKAVRATTILLPLSDAIVTPSWKAKGARGPGISNKAHATEAGRARQAAHARAKGGKPAARTCHRLTADDLA